MKVLRRIEIEEISGAWVITEGEHSRSYAHSGKEEYTRFMKDLLKHFELQNLLEIKER